MQRQHFSRETLRVRQWINFVLIVVILSRLMVSWLLHLHDSWLSITVVILLFLSSVINLWTTRKTEQPSLCPLTPEAKQELDVLIEKGKTIKAISYYRKQTAAGLKEAKEYIDALRQPQDLT